MVIAMTALKVALVVVSAVAVLKVDRAAVSMTAGLSLVRETEAEILMVMVGVTVAAMAMVAVTEMNLVSRANRAISVYLNVLYRSCLTRQSR